MSVGGVDPSVRVSGRGPSPELVGGIATVMVLAIVGVNVLSAPSSGSPGGSGATSSPAATTIVVASATPVVDPAVADLIIVVNQQLIRSAERLTQELDHDPFRTADVSTLIRQLNASARYGSDALGALGSVPEATDVGRRLGAVYDSLRETATQTLRSSITNAPAYKLGAEQLVEQAAGLPALQDELAILKSGGPRPSPTTGQPSATASVATPSTPVTSSEPSPEPSSAPPTSSPTPIPTGLSQVINGGFEAGVGEPWSLRLGPTAFATLRAEGVTVAAGTSAARVEITAATPAYSGVVLRQPGLRLAAGARYTIRVSLRSEAPRDVRIQVSSQAGETYLTRVAAATSSWSVASFDFTAPVSDVDAVIEIGLGRSAITTWLDEVYLGPPPVTLAP